MTDTIGFYVYDDGTYKSLFFSCPNEDLLIKDYNWNVSGGEVYRMMHKGQKDEELLFYIDLIRSKL